MQGLPAHALGHILLASALLSGKLTADPVPVRHPQGSSHGFLALKTLEGTRIATGVIFRFRDGSIDDDTTVFSQRGVFRLISDHHIQRGPSFPKPIDVLIEASTG